MKLTKFNHVIYRQNINLQFYLYAVKQDTTLLKYMFHVLISGLCLWLLPWKRQPYYEVFWKFLTDIKDIDKLLVSFWEKHRKYLNVSILEKIGACYVADEIPAFLLSEIQDTYGLKEAYLLPINKQDGSFISAYVPIAKHHFEKPAVYYTNRISRLLHKIQADAVFLVKGKHTKKLRWNYRIYEGIWFAGSIVLLFGLSFFLMDSCLQISVLSYNSDLYYSYYTDMELIWLNFFPVFFVMLLWYFITGRITLSFLITSVLFLSISDANIFKLMLRNDHVVFNDLNLLSETMMMSDKYSIDILLEVRKLFLNAVLVALLLAYIEHFRYGGIRFRKSFVLLSIICISSGYQSVYTDDDLYYSKGDISLVNQWNETETYMTRGFIYSFTHSINDIKVKKPDGYSKKKAEELLEPYSYEDIPDDKKVNIIAIQLEAYNDFTKFDTIDFDIDVYEKWNLIKEDAIAGEMVTKSFAGGTVYTERMFMTGSNNLPNYNTKANSYVQYFNEQGYLTEGMHPVYDWFYGRKNVNEYLGFQNYWFYENRYQQKVTEGFANDHILFQDIIEGFQASKQQDKPYLNISVTYQNHGPYADTKETDTPYVAWKDGYDEANYHIANNYFKGIYDTNDALYDLVTYFEAEEEPVIITFFGDHNPWFGDHNSVFSMFDITFDFSNPEDYLDYYATPYIIWANDAAKKITGNPFKGTGETISTMFLMNDIFRLCGYKGNPYMQFTSDLEARIDMISKEWYKENGSFVQQLSDENQPWYENYLILEYYYIHHFQSYK